MSGNESRSRIVAILAPVLALTLSPAAGAAQQERGDTITSFDLEWRTRSEGEVIRRAHAVAELMVEREVGYDGTVKPSMRRDRAIHRWKIAFSDAPELHVRYIPEYDELRVLNVDLISSYEPFTDVGEEGALEIVKKCLEELDRQDVIALRHYNLEHAQIGYVRLVGGNLEGREDYRQTTEYRVTLRRELNGIELANAGIRFSVHATGRLAGIRLGGVSVHSVFEEGIERPLGEGKHLTRRVSIGEIERRFQEALRDSLRGDADVAWSRLMYVVPEGVKRAVVEPLHVFSFALRYRTEAGAVVSRRQIVGYSVTDPEAPAVNFTAPADAQTEQRVTRKR